MHTMRHNPTYIKLKTYKSNMSKPDTLYEDVKDEYAQPGFEKQVREARKQ